MRWDHTFQKMYIKAREFRNKVKIYQNEFQIMLFRYNQKACKVERIDFTLTHETTFDK